MTILIISITIIILTCFVSFVFIIERLTKTIEKMSELIKSENLIDYKEANSELIEKENIEDDRYSEVHHLSEDELRQVKINII